VTDHERELEAKELQEAKVDHAREKAKAATALVDHRRLVGVLRAAELSIRQQRRRPA
jgi:hypothetical protein